MQAHVLIVDDDFHTRLILGTHIRRMGCQVSEAPNGQEALDIVRGVTQLNSPIDLIITDVWMPVMSGIDLLKAVHELNPDLPIAMISARATLNSSLEAINFGAYAYITKPFKSEEVQKVVERGLQKVEEVRLRNDTSRYTRKMAELEARLESLQGHSRDEGMMNELISGLRHELGNMATAIKLNLEVIKEQRNIPENLRENLDDLQASADDLVTLLTRFKEYPQPGHITQLTDLREVVAGAVDAVRAREIASRVQIDFDARDDEVLAFAAAPELSRAVLHLLENAIEAASVARGRVKVTLLAQGDQAVLQIEDDGPGFPTDLLQAPFSPSYTTKVDDGFVRGLGFGLFITRTVISLHGGDIRLENRPEGGARVVVLLPLAPASQTAA